MLNSVADFVRVLEEKEVKYTFFPSEEEGRPEVIRINYTGKNGNNMTFLYFFDADGKTLSVKIVDLCKVTTEKLMDMYVTVNEINAQYRWVKLYIDKDNDIPVEGDAIVDNLTAGDECFEILLRFLSISNDIYPRLMKVLWS